MIQNLVCRIFDSFKHKFDIPFYTDNDWKQEIAIIVVKCIKKFNQNNKTHASLDTYVYSAFSNHLKNIRKKYLFKPPLPCLKSCPFWIISKKKCWSEHLKMHCPDCKKYEKMIHDNIYILRASNLQLDNAIVNCDFGTSEFIEDIATFSETLGYSKAKIISILEKTASNGKASKKNQELLTIIVAEYLKIYGLKQ